MTEQINMWFLREVASEDCFAEDLRDQCSQVRANMEKMMLELERLRGRSNHQVNKDKRTGSVLQIRHMWNVQQALDYWPLNHPNVFGR
ncbi:hypothetical protein Tco_1575887 [Tanacetum coccineum]